MDLSIIIVSFNTKELLKSCLNSVIGSSKEFQTEIFVVDNNSSDNTAAMIKKDYPQIKLIANKKNLGFSKANNQALKLAKGKYVLILNPDTKLAPDTISEMIKFMEKDPKIAVSTCRVELPNGQIDRDCRRHFPTPWRAFCHFSKLAKLFPHSKLFNQYYFGYLSPATEHEIDSCVGAFMMVRQSIVKKVGLFDEDFFFYGEDLDWCWRFKDAGYKIMYTPRTKIIHYKGAASGMKQTSQHLTKASIDSKKRALTESVRAMEIFYKKHYLLKYPFFINWLVLISLKILLRIRIMSA
ncbi:MAG: WsbD [uncultured bacterium]|uniref:Glycosyltransferase 2-like domain-containing protein n=1 Tax=Candidatus Curtissbacteria bacterium RIFOXYA1_FULL_41_14 TaxID=1797737 RepID=A0A1F5HAH6_9BACT|nr:MAG: WsbD [uncultured bacterium]KKR58865.1 MAG: WsbD [Candidatus Curtissbacteria bacterium GW2011_GWB1_40_28]KKR62410.1 MAG: WsbD [Microgenomates group bacterium GW2011_GWC1_40_35]KKR66389.1 MAG: WsbD [Candidatus Curtissbacteria bacterium GW2011_GWA1_40_47]KKR77764.1 MAG: WsbD [Candidatus Curtissbacteria bacterium GW2011_GWD1_40_8]KKS02578.1 MAG: WsbD [Candidatus Curtissbacteria bacterium GW2011_GWC2_41_21]OGD79340.1 MAG: hypothetical protein A2683_04610 [Candidatus Curtissbacteria bacteri